MPRPALSASRSIDILDFLAAFPGRAFTLSEIARAAKINIASCHAVLSTLTERGYLSRSPKQRTYVLGPALVAVGAAAQRSQPLIERARDAADALFREFGVPVLVSGIAGDDVVGIISIPDASGRSPGLRAGQRMPLVPPVGAPFLAWAPEPEINTWLEKASPTKDSALIDGWRRSLAMIREHGYHVTLISPESVKLSVMLAELASGRRVSDYKDNVVSLINSPDWDRLEPETIDPDACYNTASIAAPIFDENGAATFNMCLGGFSDKLKGATLLNYADRLVRSCLQVMRGDMAPQ